VFELSTSKSALPDAFSHEVSSIITRTSLLAPEAERKPPPLLHEDKRTITAKRVSKPVKCFIIFFIVISLYSTL
jgi:hypothetical protein